jgi:phosphoribosylformylglycinamidine synthase
MALSGMLGAGIAASEKLDHASLFGEDQARYVITCKPGETGLLLAEAGQAGIDAVHLGKVAGSALIVEGLVSISLDELRAAHEGWFPAYMQG